MKDEWSYTLTKGTCLNCSPFSKNTDEKFSRLKIQAAPNLVWIHIISCVSTQLLNVFSVFCDVLWLNDPQMSGKMKILYRVRSLLKVCNSSSFYQKCTIVFSGSYKNAKRNALRLTKKKLAKILCYYFADFSKSHLQFQAQ